MPERNRSIQIERTLRPIRIAFLVEPSDAIGLRRSIEAASSRWGGMLSAIVPRHRRRPPGFADTRLSADDIAGGYLGVFEPDLVVETKEGMAEGLGLDGAFVERIERLEVAGPCGDLPWGLGAIHLYRDAHTREFRFLQRSPIEVRLPSCELERDEAFIDALFGRLPSTGPLGFVGRGFEEAFDPTPVVLDCSNFHELALSGPDVLAPLRTAMRGLHPVQNGMNRSGLTFIVVRPSVSADLIDFWNIRALGSRVLAVPATHIEKFAEEFARLVGDGSLPSHLRFEGVEKTIAIGAQGVDAEEVSHFIDRMASHRLDLFHQPQFPPLWDAARMRADGWERLTVEADSDRIEVNAVDNQIRFMALAPAAAGEISGSSPAWANVIRLKDWSWSSDLATVLPPELRDMRGLLGTVGFHAPTASSEGIVFCKRYPKLIEGWNLPTGNAVFEAWLRGRGFEARPSPAGRSAEQLIAALGGPLMAALVQEPDLIRLIDGAARGLVEEPGDGGPAPPRRRVISYVELQRVLNSVISDPRRAEGRLSRLVQTNVLRQGLLVNCPLCEQENWFSLDELARRLTCERCLQEFDFPHGRPPDRKRWAYRPHGPFAASSFAGGGYAVALALRFFTATIDPDEATWTTSMTLRRGRHELEFDFGLWLREGFGGSRLPKLIFGECKSFGRFEQRDLKRVAELAEEFPESFVALATLRESLEEAERAAVGALAENGGSELSGRLILLTANELCDAESFSGPPYSWQNKGGRFEVIAERFADGPFGLEELSRATLYLYAGVEE